MDSMMCLRDRPTIVLALGAGGAVDLGEDLQGFAAFALQRLAEDGFRGGVGVDVRRVEGADAGVERCPHALGGDVVLHL